MDTLELLAELNDLLNDFEYWLVDEGAFEDVGEVERWGQDPELIQWAQERYAEIQTQLDL